MSRMSPAELHDITKRERPSAQVRWFEKKYGVTLAHDEDGVIITHAAWEGLVAKQCGLVVQERPKPQLVPRQQRTRRK